MNTLSLRTLRLALVLAAVIGLSGQAMAADAVGGAPSPEKQEIAKKLHADFIKSTEATRRELAVKKHELGALMYAQNPDESKIQAVAAEISALRAKLYAARVALQTQLIKEGFAPGCGFGKGHGKGHGFGHGKGHGKRGGKGMWHGADSCCDPQGSGTGGGK